MGTSRSNGLEALGLQRHHRRQQHVHVIASRLRAR